LLTKFQGAIPPLAELQAQLWILALLDRLPHPLVPETNYRLHVSPNSRIQYGVDHESYAYQLAVDMESVPSFTQVSCKGLEDHSVLGFGCEFQY
jgi:dimethylaniline monooxygenase (N-oxide forming)